MLRRTYKVLLLMGGLAAVTMAQTAVPNRCPETARAESAIEGLVPFIPIPFLPEVLGGSLTSFLPGVEVSEQAPPQEKGDKAEKAEEYGGHFLMSLGSGSYLGVYLEEVTAERVKQLGLGEERGAVIMKVMDESPAAKAGLKENDVIVGFNGRPVDSVAELQRLLGDTPAGRTVSIDFIRGGSKQTASVTLSKRSLFRSEHIWTPKLEESLKAIPKVVPKLGNFSLVLPEMRWFGGRRLGVTVEPLTDQLAEFFGAKGGGVLITEVADDTPAARAGLKAGDVIVAVDGEKVDDPSELARTVNKKEEGQLSIKIVRDRNEKTITATLEKRPTPRPPRIRAPRTVRVQSRAV